MACAAHYSWLREYRDRVTTRRSPPTRCGPPSSVTEQPEADAKLVLHTMETPTVTFRGVRHRRGDCASSLNAARSRKTHRAGTKHPVRRGLADRGRSAGANERSRLLAGLGSAITVDVDTYSKAVNARIRYEALEPGESGYTVPKGTGFVIAVDSNGIRERQRFTVCHEIAHVVLRLPTVHGELPSWSYAKRDLNEVWCDVFASELLMPAQQFQAMTPDGDPSIEIIDGLARRFGVSFPATASRYATLAAFPCAYVTMEGGMVRYAGPNAALRRRGIRMSMKCPIPGGSIAERLRRAGESSSAVEEVAQDIWLENCDSGYGLWELSRHFPKYDQTMSLLWCTDEDLPQGEVDRVNRRVDDDDGGLEPLDGVIT